jgi:hypothetical protein
MIGTSCLEEIPNLVTGYGWNFFASQDHSGILGIEQLVGGL